MTTKKTPVRKKTPTRKKTPSKKEFGEISREARMMISALRKQSQDILAEIGRIEMRKQALSVEVRRIEKTAQELIQKEAVSLGIPKGQAWTLTPEGRAVSQ